MTPAEAAKSVAVLAAAYPNARWATATIQVYEEMLGDLDFALVKRAISRLVCTSKFLPTIAEIREASADFALGAGRNAIDAWGDVTMAIRRIGSYGAPTFKDPLVGECVRIMGWRYLCLSESSEVADRARFAELYTDMQRKQRLSDLSEPGRLLPEARAHELQARTELADWTGRPASEAPKQRQP
ncbi:MAG TPA: replicative helicase loader/inhibitor [Polyangiaceae bacterium]|nr:replicative helicase loader/inhibitor [Polyangiaceae bacterium]